MNDAVGYPLNCGTFDIEPHYVFNKGNFFENEFFKLNISPVNRITNSGTVISTQEYQDIITIEQIEASTITDYITSIEELIPGNYNISIISNNENILLSPSDNHIASGVSDGTAALIATSSQGMISISLANVTVDTNNQITILNDYTETSLSKHISDNIDTKISGLNPLTAKPIFSIQNHSAGSYTRNNNCWANDLDLTCISPWNSTGGILRAGTLISPRHVIFCEHYDFHPPIGASIRFITSDNTTVTRTITNLLSHPDYNNFYPDITIGILDSDVPNTIGFAKILPQTWSNYLPNLSSTYKLPGLILNKEEEARIADLYNLNTFASFLPPTDADRSLFYQDLESGDSGNPGFLIINNELVILTVWTYGGAGRGTNILNHKDTINSMMATLGGGYSLTEINLDQFPDYS